MEVGDLEKLISLRSKRADLSEIERKRLSKLESNFLALGPAHRKLSTYCLMSRLAELIESNDLNESNSQTR